MVIGIATAVVLDLRFKNQIAVGTARVVVVGASLIQTKALDVVNHSGAIVIAVVNFDCFSSLAPFFVCVETFSFLFN